MAAYRLETVKQMLPHICCGFLETKKCVQSRLVNSCSSSSANSTANPGVYLEQLADAMGKDMIGVACSSHTSKCNQIDSLSSSANLTTVDRNQFDREFILLPFIRVSERMAEKSNEK